MALIMPDYDTLQKSAVPLWSLIHLAVLVKHPLMSACVAARVTVFVDS